MGETYSVMIGWTRARLSFAVLWAALLCVHGSQTKWRSLGIVMVPLCQLMLLINPFVLSLVFSTLYVFVVCECFVV